MATIKELESVRLGGTVTILGQGYLIEEVDKYELGDSNWLNLVSYDQDSGMQIVFEVAEGKVKRWDEVDLPGAAVADETLEYDGEKFRRNETSTPHVTCHTEEGTEEGEVSYSVLVAASGNKLSVKEDEDGEVAVYFSRGTVPFPPAAIRVS